MIISTVSCKVGRKEASYMYFVEMRQVMSILAPNNERVLPPALTDARVRKSTSFSSFSTFLST